MTQHEALVAQLIDHEAERLRVYDDQTGDAIVKGYTVQGHPTIGVGRNLTGKGITRAESRDLLEHDIQECVADLVTFSWFERLDAVRQRVAIDLRFNLGPERLREFRQTLQAIEDARYDAASDHLSKTLWAGQVKRRATRLIAMLRTGVDPSPHT